MGFAQLQVVAMGVVHGMAMGPAVVGNQQGAVQHKTHNTFDASVRMKGVVSTLMGEDPTAHRDGACDGAVQQPERDAAAVRGMRVPMPTASSDRPTDIAKLPQALTGLNFASSAGRALSSSALLG